VGIEKKKSKGGRGRGEVGADEDVALVVFGLREFFEEPFADDLEVGPQVVARDDGEEVVFDDVSAWVKFVAEKE
jgi:hypothetical protein